MLPYRPDNVYNGSILGDVSSGKTTLIAKLQGNEEPEKGSGLEFTHLTVSDEYREGDYYRHHCSCS